MAFFFGFARPKTIFVVVACELLAGVVDDAVGAEAARLGFAPVGGVMGLERQAFDMAHDMAFDDNFVLFGHGG